MKLFFITFFIIAVCLVLLSVRLFAGKRFVRTHVDQNKALGRKGIHCAQSQDAEMRHPRRTAVEEHRSRKEED